MSALSEDRTITTTGLVVDYPTEHGIVRALRADPLQVGGGESVAIMGPSGCGKSTLLGLLGGLAVPTEGTVAVGGEAISTLAEAERIRFRRRALGMVYQSDNLLPYLTVAENVALQLAITRSDRDAATAMDPAALLARLGLARLATRLPDQLSGGERQRVAVARAVVHRPRVILADEPTGALDPRNAEIVLELLLEVHRELGATLVLVTHEPAIAGHLDRLIRLARPAAGGHAH